MAHFFSITEPDLFVVAQQGSLQKLLEFDQDIYVPEEPIVSFLIPDRSDDEHFLPHLQMFLR